MDIDKGTEEMGRNYLLIEFWAGWIEAIDRRGVWNMPSLDSLVLTRAGPGEVTTKDVREGKKKKRRSFYRRHANREACDQGICDGEAYEDEV